VHSDQQQPDWEDDSNVEVAAASFDVPSTFFTLPHETQELIHNVSILDAFYAYKKIHSVVVRGGFFCPSCLNAVANYLNMHNNNMIMGVPDEKFPFPFARLNGCRIAVPDADSNIRAQTSANLKNVISNTIRHDHLWASRTDRHIQLLPLSTLMMLVA
jgi:hypothetical protein